jgi:hypothetical protein
MMGDPQYDFFLSHNRAEKTWVAHLASALRKRGTSVFFDEDSIDIGEDIVAAISRGLSSSRYIALILSKRSVQSRWVELEWANSLYEDVNSSSSRLLPLLIEQCEIPFVLRRLKYLDLLNISPEQCADKLLTHLNKHRADMEAMEEPSNTPPIIHAGMPLPFGSPQYIERSADQEVILSLDKGCSLFVYGPRRIGKTSLMRRERARADLQGVPAAFIDLQACYAFHENQFFEYLGRTIARQLGRQWEKSSDSSAFRVYELIEDVALESEAKKALLIFDECDLLRHKEDSWQFTSILRSLMNGMFGNVQCICAGLVPPWNWPDDSPSSPWWNCMTHVRLPAFTKQEVERLCVVAGLPHSEHLSRLYALTAGQPNMIAAIANEVHIGRKLSELLDNPFSVQNLFMHIAPGAIGCGKHLLGSRTESVFTDLLAGKAIVSFRDREYLWLAGLIIDPDSSHPQIAGEVIKEALVRYLSDVREV